jgi:hypothetical protein
LAIERTFHTSGGATLVLTIPAGSIGVETIDGNETRVVVEADDVKALEDVHVDLVEAGSKRKVMVETTRKSGLLGLLDINIAGLQVGSRADFRVRVQAPHGSELNAKTASATVRALGRYRAVDVHTASGDIEIEDVDGEATLKTASGDVSIARVGGDLGLVTVSGDASVESVGGALKAQTVSGDLTVREARSFAATKTVSGDQHLTVEQGQVRTTSVSGDIEIAIRPGSRLDVDASSVSGDMRSELELADLPSIGEGPVVVLRGKTVSGDFRVVRAAPREPNAA